MAKKATFRIFTNSTDGAIKGLDFHADGVENGNLTLNGSAIELSKSLEGVDGVVSLRDTEYLVTPVNTEAFSLLLERKKGKATISLADVPVIRRRRHVNGESYKAIGNDYSLSPAGVRNICLVDGGTWQEVSHEDYDFLRSQLETDNDNDNDNDDN